MRNCGLNKRWHFTPDDIEREYQNAIRHYTKVIELDPGNVEAYYNRGETHLNINKIPEAIQDFSEIIKLDPGNADAYYSRGNAYLLLEEWEKAKADLITSENMGVDIGTRFHSNEESIEAFEVRMKVPEDIAVLLELRDTEEE